MQLNLPLATGCYTTAYLTGCAMFVYMAKRRKLATRGIYTIATAGLIGGLVTANLTQRMTTGVSGKTILGAIVGGWLSVTVAKRVIGLRRPTGDLFAVAICAGEAVGRWGCFYGGCCYGKPSTVLWAVWQHDAYRHPTQIYLSLASLAILLVLILHDKRAPSENSLFYLQGLLYCLARFVIEFYREGKSLFWNLTLAQVVCIIGIIVFSYLLHRCSSKQGVTLDTVS